jgi:hypothetical protein
LACVDEAITTGDVVVIREALAQISPHTKGSGDALARLITAAILACTSLAGPSRQGARIAAQSFFTHSRGEDVDVIFDLVRAYTATYSYLDHFQPVRYLNDLFSGRLLAQVRVGDTQRFLDLPIHDEITWGVVSAHQAGRASLERHDGDGGLWYDDWFAHVAPRRIVNETLRWLGRDDYVDLIGGHDEDRRRLTLALLRTWSGTYVELLATLDELLRD